MEQRILADLEIKSRVKEYITIATLLTTQISCAFRNLTWFLTGHGYYNEDDNMACKRFKELCSIYCGNLNLNHWKLSGANLFEANLSEANLSGADLSGARYCLDENCKTIFPDGFVLEEYSMIEVDFLGNPVKKSEIQIMEENKNDCN